MTPDIPPQDTSPLPPIFHDSSHLSARTRRIFLDRMTLDRETPRTLSPEAFALLEQIVQDILPQEHLPGQISLPLAVWIDHALAGPRDGWRFAALPPDREAWEAGLTTLNAQALHRHGRHWHSLDATQRGSLLDDAFDGSLPSLEAASLTPEQMALWSGDLRAEIVSHALAHPTMQEALGLSAALTGGDRSFQGFHHVGPDQRENFEPPSPPMPSTQAGERS